MEEIEGEDIRQQQRVRQIVRGVIATLTGLVLLAAVATIQRLQVVHQGKIALSRQLAAEALSADPTDPVAARRLAVAAWSVSPTGQADAAMTAMLSEQQQDGLLPVDSGNLNGIALSPDGRLLAIADRDGTIRLWNPATGQPVRAPITAGDALKGVAFSPDGTLLASAGGDGTVRLWDPATGRPIGAPLDVSSGEVHALAFGPNGKLLASASTDGTVRLWKIQVFTDPYAALCADVGPPTKENWAKYAAGQPQPSACT